MPATCILTYTCTYIHKYLHTASCTYILLYTYIRTYTHIHCCISYTHTFMRIYIRIYINTYIHTYSSGQKSSHFFSVQQNATEGKRKRNGNATESLTFRSCNSLEPQMLYLLFNSTFPNLPPGAKTLEVN